MIKGIQGPVSLVETIENASIAIEKRRVHLLGEIGLSADTKLVLTQARIDPGSTPARLARGTRFPAKRIEQLTAELLTAGLLERRNHPTRPGIYELHVNSLGVSALESAELVEVQLELWVKSRLDDPSVISALSQIFR